MLRVPFISLLSVLGMVACSGRDPVDDRAANAAGLPDIAARAPTSIGEPHNTTEPAKPLPASTVTIPATLQGRWGLSPADCIPGRSDAKGLLIVTPRELRFYESRAVPGPDVQADPGSISGHFAFAGEGQSWTRYEALKIDKQVLVRTEANPTASFSYAKCS